MRVSDAWEAGPGTNDVVTAPLLACRAQSGPEKSSRHTQ